MTDDQKVDTLRQIKNAYGALDLYGDKKMTKEETSAFSQTAFLLSAHAIAQLATVFGLESKIKAELEEKACENKERNQKIAELEQQLGAGFDPERYEENMKRAFLMMEEKWKAEGFTGLYKPKITAYGGVFLSFILKPVREVWDLLDEEEDEEKIEALFQLRQQRFFEKAFQTVNEGSYVHVVDSDENKRKIEQLLKRLFPTLEIERWETQKHNTGLGLTHVEVSIKSMNFLEGSQ